MHRWLWIVVLFPALWGCSEDAPKKSYLVDGTMASAIMQWGTPMRGMRLALETKKRIYRTDEDPVLVFHMQNASNGNLASVPPSVSEDSEFPLLVSFSFVRFGPGSAREELHAGQRYPKSIASINPGANEFAIFPKDKVFSIAYPISSFVSGKEERSLVLDPGEYEVVATYFIRASTVKYISSRFEKDTVCWAGEHLKSNSVRFVIESKKK